MDLFFHILNLILYILNWDHQRTYSEIKEQHYNEQVLIHSFNFIFTFALQIFWKSTETFSKINFWDLEAFMIIVRAQKRKKPSYLTYMIPTWTIFSIWKVAPYWPWCILDLDTTVATITTSDSNMYSANNLTWRKDHVSFSWYSRDSTSWKA